LFADPSTVDRLYQQCTHHGQGNTVQDRLIAARLSCRDMEPNTFQKQLKEETLDPGDWSAFRQFAHRVLDDAIDHASGIRQLPVWRGVPEVVKAELREPPPPEDPEGTFAAYEDFRRLVLPYTYANIHPRAWGWVIGAGTASSIIHEMLTAALNANVFGTEQSPVYVERQVLGWFKQKLGYPAEASGLLVSGASMANLMGLAVARTQATGGAVVREGVPRPFTIYCSREAHYSITKAATVLGLGSDALRRLPVDEKFRLSIPDLVSCLSADRQNGRTPLCVVGAAGTTNTGAIDDLEELAKISNQFGVWFHVDGAFGVPLKLSSSLAPLVSGIEKADSIAFDLHKWMHASQGTGCMLTRHPQWHQATFSVPASYTSSQTRGIASANMTLLDYTVEGSRPFRALGAWLAIKEYGFKKYARLIEQNVAQARMMADLVREQPQLRLLAANLNIVCFQFVSPGLTEVEISELNRELLYRLHETGMAAPSYTDLDGRFVIRVSITNHRTTSEDVVLFVREAVRIGRELVNTL
jgi:aromatic-L-amino-acid/L-tryptophan decarboxylase